jgi:hypothetical protein
MALIDLENAYDIALVEILWKEMENIDIQY